MLSRPSETVWTSRQIFRFCAWLLSSLFGAPASWVDRTPNQMAAALTIRPLLTRLADVLEGRAGDCRGRLTSWHRHLRRRGRPRSRDVQAAARAALTRRGAPEASRSPAGPSTSPGTCHHLSQHPRQKQVVASAGRGAAAVLAGVVIAWAWSEGSTRVRLWVPADSRGPGGSTSAMVPGNRAEQALS